MKSTIAFLLAAAPCLIASSNGLLAASPRPNIVVILVDDLGWSDIGCYGGEIETPNLDQLAQNGVRFTQFYNTARCCPTRAATKRMAAERPLFWEHQGNKAVRLGDWKAVAPRGGRWELYHLAEDRTEGQDIANTSPEKTRLLARLWRDWANRCGVWDWGDLEKHRRKRARPQGR